MSRTILVVDDEVEIVNIVSEFLLSLNYKVCSSVNGEQAKQVALKHSPDLIISDIRMPILDGVKFFQWSCHQLASTPFIFMTSFSEILDMENQDFSKTFTVIKKPFDFDEIEKVLNKVFLNFQEVRIDKTFCDEDFYRINIKKFVSGKNIPCSIFIKIRSNHFVKLAHKNDPLPSEDLKKYKNKNVQHLYVLKTEYSEFIGFNLKLLSRLSSKNKINNEKILSFLGYTNEIILEKTFVKELDPSLRDDIVEFSKQTFEIIKDHSLLVESLDILANHSDYVYAHSLCVAIMAYLIAKELGWSQESKLFNIFLAGLLHDVGLKNVPVHLITKNPVLFTDEEKKIYELHPLGGMEFLKGIGGIPEEVIMACYQHHEDLLGHGYPLKISKSKKWPISMLVSVADIVDEKMIGEKNISLNQYRKAVNEVLKFKKKYYHKEFLMALCSILNVKYI